MSGLAARASRTTLACGHRDAFSAKTGARARRPPPARAAVVPSPHAPIRGALARTRTSPPGRPCNPRGFSPRKRVGSYPPN